MKNLSYFTSSVGQKLVMAATGIFLILFLVVHFGLNACIWANDGGKMFNHAAHFMGSNWLPRLLEVGLFLGILLHIIQGIVLELTNRKKRGKLGYKIAMGNRSSKWYSRSMGLLGTILLLFLIVHLWDFWIPNRSHQGFLLGEEINLYTKMQLVFSNPWVVIFYLVGCFSLAFHLLHGFKSAFITFGLHNQKWLGIVKCMGWIFSIFISIGFALMPISFYFGWIN